MNTEMTQDLTLAEVVDAITSMLKRKTPGHDGLSSEFFQETVEVTAPTLFLAFRAMLSLGQTLNFINKGTITLILKSTDHSKLGNWHSITFLSIYKILAKILAQRIQAHLPIVISPIQRAL
jgi:hypothetical protein